MKQRTILNEEHLKKACADLSRLGGRLPLVITVTEGTKTRTSGQNARYWCEIEYFMSEVNEAIEKAKWAIAGNEIPTPVAIREINLHEDHTIEKAIPLVKDFLDECYRDNVRRVRIIHGKGIGVLRQAVSDYLEIHRYIVRESISFADKDHGGEGATEANLIEFPVSAIKR